MTLNHIAYQFCETHSKLDQSDYISVIELVNLILIKLTADNSTPAMAQELLIPGSD